MDDVKQERMMRPFDVRKIDSKRSFTDRSDGVYPPCSALVLSEKSASTPWSPYAASVWRSNNLPSIGVGSILKSPVWMIVPTGVLIASANESTIECVTWKKSTLKQPTSIGFLGVIV